MDCCVIVEFVCVIEDVVSSVVVVVVVTVEEVVELLVEEVVVLTVEEVVDVEEQLVGGDLREGSGYCGSNSDCKWLRRPEIVR